MELNFFASFEFFSQYKKEAKLPYVMKQKSFSLMW